MPEDLKILVKLTLKDLRDFTIAGVYARAVDKIMLVFYIIMILFFGLGILSDFVTGKSNHNELYIILLVIFTGLIFLPGMFQYLAHRNNYRKSKLLSDLQCYEFLDEGLRTSSSVGSSTMKWSDIFMVLELKPCFLIFLSPLKYFLIPKRCLHSKEELELLRRMITQHMDPKQRKLKKYRLGQVAPDTGEIIIPQSVELLNENPETGPLMELDFFLTKQEQLKFHFQHYYTSPSGSILTVLGAMITLLVLIGLFNNSDYYVTLLILGLGFIVFAPLFIYINVSKQYNQDPAFKLKHSFKIYEDYFTLHQPNTSEYRLQWRDLVKGKEFGVGILLYLTTGLVLYIPKRVLAENPADYEKLRRLLKSKIPSKPIIRSFKAQ